MYNGKVPLLRQLLNGIDKGFANGKSYIFTILMERMEISLWLCELLMFKALIIFMISLLSKTIEENLLLVTTMHSLGQSQHLLRGVY